MSTQGKHLNERQFADVLKLDIGWLIGTAQAHGEDSDPEHEIGDLQELLQAAFQLMTPEQRLHLFARGVCPDSVAQEADMLDDVGERDLDELLEACTLLGVPLPAGRTAAELSEADDDRRADIEDELIEHYGADNALLVVNIRRAYLRADGRDGSEQLDEPPEDLHRGRAEFPSFGG